MGKAPTSNGAGSELTSPKRDRTPTDPRDVLAPTRRRDRIRKFCAPPGRWNPTRSAPSRPSMISVRHGICMNSSTGGNGMCRKKPMVRSGRSIAQHLRHQLQLVVLDPYRRRRGRRRASGFGEAAVDVDIAVPPFAVVDRLDDDVVVQRPQRGVREALVVLGDVVGGQAHRVKGAGRPGRWARSSTSMASVVGWQARPADPGPRRRRSSGSRAVTNPPGLRFQVVRAVGKPLQIDRQPIGDHHEVGIPEGADFDAGSGLPREPFTPRASPAQYRAWTGRCGTRRRRSRTRRRRAWPGLRCCRPAARRRRFRQDQIS